ncbi:MAG TPA: hypothetical protein VE753_04565 [Gaiellaceae bacterium]|jgi:hypothetical protein|nr:hypothetical protein [Gaiellaceae bacterium]
MTETEQKGRTGEGMADEQGTSTGGGRSDSFAKGLLGTVARKALVPLAATGATAATTYLTRKGSSLWQERIQPAVEARGGPRAALKEVLETGADKTGGRVSSTLSALAERVGEGGSDGSTDSTQPQQKASASDEAREEQRNERRRRREQRQQALEKSGPT